MEGDWGKVYIRSLCIIVYNCMWIYNYLKMISLILETLSAVQDNPMTFTEPFLLLITFKTPSFTLGTQVYEIKLVSSILIFIFM